MENLIQKIACLRGIHAFRSSEKISTLVIEARQRNLSWPDKIGILLDKLQSIGLQFLLQPFRNIGKLCCQILPFCQAFHRKYFILSLQGDPQFPLRGILNEVFQLDLLAVDQPVILAQDIAEPRHDVFYLVCVLHVASLSAGQILSVFQPPQQLPGFRAGKLFPALKSQDDILFTFQPVELQDSCSAAAGSFKGNGGILLQMEHRRLLVYGIVDHQQNENKNQKPDTSQHRLSAIRLLLSGGCFFLAAQGDPIRDLLPG